MCSSGEVRWGGGMRRYSAAVLMARIDRIVPPTAAHLARSAYQTSGPNP